MSKESKRKIFGGVIKLLGIILGIYVASYAWFNDNEDVAFGEITVFSNKVNNIQVSLNDGLSWSNNLVLEIPPGFKFSNEVTSDGTVFFKALNKRDDGTPIAFQNAIVNHDYLEFKMLIKAQHNTGIFLEENSFVNPASGTTSEALLGITSLNLSMDGEFSKDLIAGAVRVAFIENSLNNDNEFVTGNTTKLVWAPNKNYKIVENNGVYTASINSNENQDYNYVDANEETYYFEKRVPNIKDTISASYIDLEANGDPLLTYIDNTNGEQIKSLTIRIWIEGNDRDAVTALKGGVFAINIGFVGIDKDFREIFPLVSANTSTNEIVGINDDMEYSTDYGNTWTRYQQQNLVFSNQETIYVRYFETETYFASEYVTLNF